ncbi:TRAP transporter small permease subunit [Breoghania sp.]|uniref:TRAP transporter small permease subunit n=1 Tax=Breoghania sp. TaxID=2065378 RepID=UPI0026232FA5|nr:TRAP transporter small permease subunit [Breoghania sp.]MDJ0931758.1 TRAP transporter small permease subunit [Breoghania sp.]
MPKAIRAYVRWVDALSRVIGHIAMYLVFAMMGILLYSSFMKSFFIPPLWGLEMAQFLMVGYYIMGGAWLLQSDNHVRMDLIYSRWTPRTRAAIDAVTVLFLLFYLGVLLYGGLSSTAYALEYGERSYSAWRPYMAPIKIIMCAGIVLMLLQTVAVLFKDLARLRGESLT